MQLSHRLGRSGAARAISFAPLKDRTEQPISNKENKQPHTQ